MMGNLMLSLIIQDPQVVTGSHDSTIKFWDLRYGNSRFYANLFPFSTAVSLFLTSLFSGFQEKL